MSCQKQAGSVLLVVCGGTRRVCVEPSSTSVMTVRSGCGRRRGNQDQRSGGAAQELTSGVSVPASTLVCSPNWPEILDVLLPGQHSNDRRNIIARVFRPKLLALLEDLLQHHVWGRPSATAILRSSSKTWFPSRHIFIVFDHQDNSPSRTDD